jgi:ATP-binding cassette subfamily C protein CydD
MAWMGQAPHVFAGSVEANVALGRDRHRHAAGQWQRCVSPRSKTVAQAQPGVALGEGGQRPVGRRGVRLALARIAVHPHADLLLVDEPTAHLDTETAERVTDALVALARGKTLIVATHDPVLAARMHRT